ncbi:MAG: type I glutamate--ammonia ligase [Saccharofermentanales bacterium]
MDKFVLRNDLLYTITKDMHSADVIKQRLISHPEIRFVSLVGIDLSGNDTDERIPVKLFLDNIEEFLNGAIQTDGSSVVLPGIATLNDGKVDFIADTSVCWFVDYNYENLAAESGKPVGTLRIPCFLMHNGKEVCSRSVLKRAVNHFNSKMLELFRSRPDLCSVWNITPDDIENITLTSATELEFWVRTPDDRIVVEQLSVSQGMKEQYWKRTKGVVRTALENSVELLDRYGFHPEMGHKEVGGVKSHLSGSGNMVNIMEQLEIDWKYSSALQTADNELFARIFIKEVFRLHGLEATFMAKPVEGVAGSGEHIHVNAVATLKNGKKINLFSPADYKKDYLNTIGWGALMGILKHYDVLGAFITVTNDAFNRLKPGFEAPTHPVASIGMDKSAASRNRTVLLGLIRDEASPLSTRFELRSPNPHTNVFLCLGAIFQCALDGISYAVVNDRSADDLESEFCKEYGIATDYLPADRIYRTEEDVFKKYTNEERDRLFGTPPYTVYETLSRLLGNSEGLDILTADGVFSDRILESYSKAMRRMWKLELSERILPKNIEALRQYRRIHADGPGDVFDAERWDEIEKIKNQLAKDSKEYVSVFSRIRQDLEARNYSSVSDLQRKMSGLMTELEHRYAEYKRNIL